MRTLARINKFIVACVGLAVVLGVPNDVAQAVAAVLTAAAVFLVPNAD